MAEGFNKLLGYCPLKGKFVRMEYMLGYIDGLAALNPVLPSLLKLSLIILICLIAYLPVSLLAWVLSRSFGKALGLFKSTMSNIHGKALQISKNLKAQAKDLLESHYEQNTTRISFEDVKYQFSGHSVQNALDNLTTTLQQASTVAADREEQKSQLVQQVNENLENLVGGVDSMKHLDIPELELDTKNVIKKKRALSSLILFIPLLIAVVAVNTSLLNTFFDELMGGREIFDYIPYSIVIALMFTFIELGTGVATGFQKTTKEKEGAIFSIGNYILSFFCWFIVFGLAFVEFFLYLLVGTSEELDRDEIFGMLLDGAYADIVFKGGWLSILGLAIVFALYVFGHLVSINYYNYSEASNLESFKNDLDRLFKKYEFMRSGIDKISEKITELIKKIRVENINLNEIDGDKAKALDQFRKTFNNQKVAISTVVAEAENLEMPTPKIQVQKLSLEDSKSFHHANIFYLLALLASLTATTLSLPVISIGDFTLSGLAITFAIALLLISLSVVAGMILSTKVSIVTTSDGSLAKLVLEKHSALNLSASLGILLIIFILLYLMFSQSGFISNVIPFIFCSLSIVGAFLAGRSLIQAIRSWYVTAAVIWLYFTSAVVLLFSFLISIIEKISSSIIPILDSFSFPVRFVLRRA